MATWSGWQDDLINAVGLTPSNKLRTGLTIWNQHTNTDCSRNPLDLSHKETGSSNCKGLPGGKTAQNYPTSAPAARAFADQLNSGDYQHLYSYLIGTPLWYNNTPPAVLVDLIAWGSLNFAQWISTTWGVPLPPSPGPNAAGIHKGYHDFRRAVNTSGPASLRDADKLAAAALRALKRARKVKL